MSPEATLRRHLAALYGHEDAGKLDLALGHIIGDYIEGLSPSRRPPRARSLSQDDVFLIIYGDQVSEPGRPHLRTLVDVLDTPFGGAVSGVHILRLNLSSADTGAPADDYPRLDPALGSWEDHEALRARYRLMVDAVLNRVSTGSRWFKRFLAGDRGAEAWFHTVGPGADPGGAADPQAAPLLTPFETAGGTRRVRTTFGRDQIDLNFANPDVLLQTTELLLWCAGCGADLIRLDAIDRLWKGSGADSTDPESSHRVVQIWRAALDQLLPHVLLVADTSAPQADNVSYLGDGASEAQLVYQLPLAPLTLHAFATGDATRLSGWAASLPPPPPGAAFFNVLASQDGISLTPAAGLLSQAEVQGLCAQVERHGGQVSHTAAPDGSQRPDELNCTWFDALSDPAAGEPQGRAVDRFIASQAIMLALQGVPAVYVHSLLGSPNDHAGLARTGRGRDLNREKWERAELEARIADPTRREGAVLSRMVALLRVRRGEPAFHPGGPQRILDLGPGVFALERRPLAGGAPVLCIHSVSPEPQTVRVPLHDRAADLLGRPLPAAGRGHTLELHLEPYAVRWLRLGR